MTLMRRLSIILVITAAAVLAATNFLNPNYLSGLF